MFNLLVDSVAIERNFTIGFGTGKNASNFATHCSHTDVSSATVKIDEIAKQFATDELLKLIKLLDNVFVWHNVIDADTLRELTLDV